MLSGSPASEPEREKTRATTRAPGGTSSGVSDSSRCTAWLASGVHRMLSGRVAAGVVAKHPPDDLPDRVEDRRIPRRRPEKHPLTQRVGLVEQALPATDAVLERGPRRDDRHVGPRRLDQRTDPCLGALDPGQPAGRRELRVAEPYGATGGEGRRAQPGPGGRLGPACAGVEVPHRLRPGVRPGHEPPFLRPPEQAGEPAVAGRRLPGCPPEADQLHRAHRGVRRAGLSRQPGRHGIAGDDDGGDERVGHAPPRRAGRARRPARCGRAAAPPGRRGGAAAAPAGAARRPAPTPRWSRSAGAPPVTGARRPAARCPAAGRPPPAGSAHDRRPGRGWWRSPAAGRVRPEPPRRRGRVGRRAPRRRRTSPATAAWRRG